MGRAAAHGQPSAHRRHPITDGTGNRLKSAARKTTLTVRTMLSGPDYRRPHPKNTKPLGPVLIVGAVILVAKLMGYLVGQ